MDRVNGADWFDIGGGKRGFRAQNAGLGIPGTEVTDTWLNNLQEELLYLVEQLGLAPNAAITTQIAQTLRGQKHNYMVAAGTANTLTVAAPTPTLVAYTLGLPVRLKIAITNTGPATLNINALGAKGILHQSGAPLVGGELVANEIVDLIYDGVAFRFAAQRARNTTDDRPWWLYLTDTGQGAQSVATGVTVRCNNMVVTAGNVPGAMWSGTTFICDAARAGLWVVQSRTNINSELGEEKYIYVNGVVWTSTLFAASTGATNVTALTTIVPLSAGDSIEFYYGHNTGSTRSSGANHCIMGRLS